MNKFNFSPFPNLSTKRFNLRRITQNDVNEIFVSRSDPEINKFLDRPPAETIEDAELFIEKIERLILKNEAIDWAISYKEDSKLIGSICLWQISIEKSKAEIGFELLKEHHGKGIMQEVIPVVINFGFEVMGLEKIVGEADPKNIKSIKLMERFGFSYDREFENTIIYSLKSPEQKKKSDVQ